MKPPVWSSLQRLNTAGLSRDILLLQIEVMEGTEVVMRSGVRNQERTVGKKQGKRAGARSAPQTQPSVLRCLEFGLDLPGILPSGKSIWFKSSFCSLYSPKFLKTC